VSEEIEICCDCGKAPDACHCGESEADAGRRFDEERNDRAGQEINALAKVRKAHEAFAVAWHSGVEAEIRGAGLALYDALRPIVGDRRLAVSPPKT
jgi:hypothetical protein